MMTMLKITTGLMILTLAVGCGGGGLDDAGDTPEGTLSMYYHLKDRGQFVKLRDYVTANSLKQVPTEDGEAGSVRMQEARGFVVDHKEETSDEAILYCRVWFSSATKQKGGRPSVARLAKEDGAWKFDIDQSVKLSLGISKGKTSFGFYDGTEEWWK